MIGAVTLGAEVHHLANLKRSSRLEAINLGTVRTVRERAG